MIANPYCGQMVVYCIDSKCNIVKLNDPSSWMKIKQKVLVVYKDINNTYVLVAATTGVVDISIDNVAYWKTTNSDVYAGINQYMGYKVKWFNINDDNIETDMTPEPALIRKAPHEDGACCVQCKTFIPYAETNIVCYSCRQDPYRCSVLNIDDDI